MYVNIEDKNEVAVFDPLKLKVITYWQLAPLETPTGMAIDHERKRLFVVGRNKLMAVINTENGKIISTLPIGGGVDGCAYDPATHLVFSSNNEGTITIIQQTSADDYKVIDNVATQKGARTMTLDKKTHKIYTSALVDEKSNSVTKDTVKKRFGVLVLESR